MLKDVRHTLREAPGGMSVAQAAEELYARAAENGHADDDFAAVITAVRGQSEG
jgi:3-hydroxyisobutyrate dehydrogenase-like beta-hydroxyacid dehydrogenase